MMMFFSAYIPILLSYIGAVREIEKYTQFVYYGINMIRIIPVKDLVQKGTVYHSDW